jgi:enterochelin esterase family protein
MFAAIGAFAQEAMTSPDFYKSMPSKKMTSFRDSQHPASASAPALDREISGICDTLLFEDFDSGAPGWTFADLWSETFWHTSSSGAYSGQSYWCGDEQLGGYDDHWQQTLTSPPINLAGATAPALTFMHHFRIEDCDWIYFGFDGFDAITVRVSTDGEIFNIISPSMGKPYQSESASGFYYRFGAGMPGWFGNSNGWISSGFDLSAYAGQTIWIQFLFGSDWAYASQDDPALFGWRVDDIRIMDGSNVIFEDDAGDNGLACFVPGGAAGYNLWHITPSAYFSPPSGAGCFDNESGHYRDGMISALVSPVIAVNDLPAHTRELKIDFKIQGDMDHSGYDPYFPKDVFYMEIKPFHDGQWDYWSAFLGLDLIPDHFCGFEEFYHQDLDISYFMDADSLQIRFQLMTPADGAVMTPARIFLDDFSLVARTGYDGPVFGAFYDRISVAPLLQRPAIADSFMATLPVCPLVEDESIVTFLYNGDVSRVTIPGINFSWDTSNCLMNRIIGTDLWFYQTLMTADARQEYKLFINGAEWINDPLNPDIVPFEFNNSRIAMPDYQEPAENDYYAGIPHGNYYDTLFASKILGNSRTIRVYVPAGYESGQYERYPVILFHDGMAYFNDGNANNVLDYLISENRIRPVIAVFVSPVAREDEYAFNKTAEFEYFIIDEVMPMIDAEYRTILEPEYRAMTGCSFGGLITTQICYNHPGQFGLCAPFSPSYWAKNMEVFYSVIDGPKEGLKFYIDWGIYELGIMWHSMIFRDNLHYKGYEVMWNAWNDNHGMGNWRAHLDNMLEYFFPPSTAVNETQSKPPLALRVFPNPASSEAGFEYQLGGPATVTLSVLNSAGQLVLDYDSGPQGTGQHQIKLNTGELCPGIYYYRIKLNEGPQFFSGKLVIIR